MGAVGGFGLLVIISWKISFCRIWYSNLISLQVCRDTPVLPASVKASMIYVPVDYVCMCPSGPGQYNVSVKSFPQMALISSREDRFKVSTNTNPGPGAHQVNMLLKLHLTLMKHSYLPTHSTWLLEQPTFSDSALTSVYVQMRASLVFLYNQEWEYDEIWDPVCVSDEATNTLCVWHYVMLWSLEVLWFSDFSLWPWGAWEKLIAL